MNTLHSVALLLALASCLDAPAATIVVNTVGSSATGCTLEDAIQAANQNSAVGLCPAGQAAPVTDTIAFAIPPFDDSVKTIQSTPQLPGVAERVLIDGLTQPGSSCTGGFPALRIAITGPSDSFGLVIDGSDITVRGLAIHGFFIQIFAGHSPEGAQRNVVQCNVLGMDPSGTVAGAGALQPQSTGVRISHGIDNVIGTDGDGVNDAAEGNWIAGNERQVWLFSVDGPATGNRVSGNRIGLNAAGTGPPQGAVQRIGIDLKEGVRGALIGSDGNGVSDDAEGNVVAFNDAQGGEAGAVLVRFDSLQNTIRGNSIFAHASLGLDLAMFGEEGISEPNDALDADTGANELQNRPALLSAARVGAGLRLVGALDSAPSQAFEIELFGNAACNASGFGPGEQPLGRTWLTTDATGHASFDVLLPEATTPAWITALATDTAGNTSEFSACVPAALFRDGFEG